MASSMRIKQKIILVTRNCYTVVRHISCFVRRLDDVVLSVSVTIFCLHFYSPGVSTASSWMSEQDRVVWA